MNVELIFQIAAVGIIVSVLNQLLNKSDRSEQAMMVTLAGLVIVMLLVLTEIKELFDTIRSLFQF